MTYLFGRTRRPCTFALSILVALLGASAAISPAQVSAPTAPARTTPPMQFPSVTPTLAPVTPSPSQSTPAGDTMGRAPVAPSSATGKAAAAKLSFDIHWVRDSAEYRACTLQAFGLAAKLAEENAKGMTSGTWCVATDADETILDNSQFQKELGNQSNFSPAKWTDWIAREEATPIAGAIAYINRVHELGGLVVVITNRRVGEQQAHTEANFKKVGLPYDIMLGQGDDRYKDSRFESVEKGTAKPGVGPLKIVVFTGDNIQDFPQLRQDVLSKDDQAFGEFGKHYVIIPNPMYGSWTGNPER